MDKIITSIHILIHLIGIIYDPGEEFNMRSLTKNMLLVGPIVLAFIVALVTPVIQVYFMKLVSTQILTVSNMLALGLGAVTNSSIRREKIMNIYLRHFNIIVVVDMILFAVISGLSTEMIVVRFLGFSILNAVTSTLWGAVIQDRINNVLHGSELTDWSALLSAYRLYAALIGSALLFIIVSMPIEVAIGLQCFGNTAMGLLDIKAYKLLKEDQNNQQKE